MASLRVNEIFHSIQGESTWAGLPCLFIRLTGCPLRCCYCDTEYAFSQGQTMTLDQIIDQADRLTGGRTKLAELTGGEPLIQPACGELISRLVERGWTVLVETSGACDIALARPAKIEPGRVVLIMDIKTPGSGEVKQNLWSNLDRLTLRDEVKFVICDRSDYDWAVGLIREHHLADRVNAILFSAAARMAATSQLAGCDGLAMADLASWILADGLGDRVRLQMQLHKAIWPPQTRGV